MATVLDIITKALTAIGANGRGDTPPAEDVDDARDHLNALIDELLPFMVPASTELVIDTQSTKSVVKFSTLAYSEFQVPRCPSDVLSLHYLDGSDWVPMPRAEVRSFPAVQGSTEAESAPVAWVYCVTPGVGVGSVTTCSEIRFASPLLPCRLRAVVSSLPGNLENTDEWSFVGPLSSYLRYSLQAALAPEYGKDAGVWSQAAEMSMNRLRMQNAVNPIANSVSSEDIRSGSDLGFL